MTISEKQLLLTEAKILRAKINNMHEEEIQKLEKESNYWRKLINRQKEIIVTNRRSYR